MRRATTRPEHVHVDERPTMARAPECATERLTAGPLVEAVHGKLGNTVLSDAVVGGITDGLHGVVADELAWATEQAGPLESALDSNQVMLRALHTGRDVAADVGRWIAHSQGAPLSRASAARFAAILGRDVSRARVHDDDAAARAADALGAKAFALGTEIFLGASARPGTLDGDAVIAHELMHVVQHEEGRLPRGEGEGLQVSRPTDPAEREASSIEREVLTAGTPLLPVAGEPDAALRMETLGTELGAGAFTDASTLHRAAAGPTPQGAQRPGPTTRNDPARDTEEEEEEEETEEVGPDAEEVAENAETKRAQAEKDEKARAREAKLAGLHKPLDDGEAGAQGAAGAALEPVGADGEATQEAGGGQDAEAIAKLEAEKADLEDKIAWRTIDIESSEQDLAALEGKKGEESTRRGKHQDELGKRKARLKRDAKKAEERGGKPKDPEKDARVKSIQRDIGNIGKKLDQIAKDQADEHADAQEHREAREKLQERLQEVEQELAALRSKGGGGGGGGSPLPIDIHATLPSLIAALEARKSAAVSALAMLETGSSSEVVDALKDASADTEAAQTKADQAKAEAEENEKAAALSLKSVEELSTEYKAVLGDISRVTAELATAQTGLEEARGKVTTAREALKSAQSEASGDEGGEAGADAPSKAVTKANAALRGAEATVTTRQRQVERLQAELAELEADRDRLEKALKDRGADLDKLRAEEQASREEAEAAQLEKVDLDETEKELTERARAMEDRVADAAANLEDQSADLPTDPASLRDLIDKTQRMIDALYGVDLGNPNDAAVEELVGGATSLGINLEPTRYTAESWAKEQELRETEKERKAIAAVQRNHPELDEEGAKRKIKEMAEEKKRKEAEAEKKAKEEEAQRKKDEAEKEQKTIDERAKALQEENPNLSEAAAKAQAVKLVKDESEQAEKTQTRAAIASKVAEYEMLPKAERDAKMAELAKQYEKELGPGETVETVASAQNKSTKEKLDALGLGRKSSLTPEELKSAGLTQAEVDAMRKQEDVDTFKANLTATLTTGEDVPTPEALEAAKAALVAEAARRGCAPADLLNDMRYLPEGTFADPALANLAGKARQSAPTELSVEEQSAAAESAKVRQERFDKRKAFAEKNKMSLEEANAHLTGLAGSSRLSEDQFLDAYDPNAAADAGAAKGPKALQDELQAAREIEDPELRQAAIAKVIANHGVDAMIAAQGVERDADGNVKTDRLTGGPVATKGLATTNAAIDAIEDPAERAIARMNLAKRHGVSLGQLGESIENRKERSRLARGYAKIKDDMNLDPDVRDRMLKEYADENGVALDDLEANKLEEEARINAAMDRLQRRSLAKVNKGTEAKLAKTLSSVAGMLGADGAKGELDEMARALDPEAARKLADMVDGAKRGTLKPDEQKKLADILDLDVEEVGRTVAANEAKKIRSDLRAQFDIPPGDEKRFREVHKDLAVNAAAYPGWSVMDYANNLHRMRPEDMRPADLAMRKQIVNPSPEAQKEGADRAKLDETKGQIDDAISKGKRLEKKRDAAERELNTLHLIPPDKRSSAQNERIAALDKERQEYNDKIRNNNGELGKLRKATQEAEKLVAKHDEKALEVQAAARSARDRERAALEENPELATAKDRYALIDAMNDVGAAAEGAAAMSGTTSPQMEEALAGATAKGEVEADDATVQAELAKIKGYPADQRMAALKALATRYGSTAIRSAALNQPADAAILPRNAQKRLQQIQGIADPVRRERAMAAFRARTGLTEAQLVTRSEETERQDRGLAKIHAFRTTAMTAEKRAAARAELLAPKGEYTEAELEALETRYESEKQAIEAQLAAARQVDKGLDRRMTLRDRLRRVDQLTPHQKTLLLNEIRENLGRTEGVTDPEEAAKLLNDRIASDAGIQSEDFGRHEEAQAHEAQIAAWGRQLPSPHNASPASIEEYITTQAERAGCEPGDFLDNLAAADPSSLDPTLREVRKNVVGVRTADDKARAEQEALEVRQGHTQKKDEQTRKAEKDERDKKREEATTLFTDMYQGEEAARRLGSLPGAPPDATLDPASARAFVDAYALANGKTRAEALAELEADPEGFARRAQGAFQDPKGPHKRAELDRIRRIEDPKAREAAMRGLAFITGESTQELTRQSNELQTDDEIVAAMHSYRDLPAADRAAKLAEIAKTYRMSPAEVEALYTERKDALEEAAGPHLEKDADGRAKTEVGRKLQRLASLRDLSRAQGDLEAIARELRLPISDVQMLIEAERSLVQHERAEEYLEPEGIDTAKRLAASRGQSLEELLDYAATASDEALADSVDKEALKALRETLRRKGYEVRFEDEVEAAEHAFKSGKDFGPEDARLVRQRLFDKTISASDQQEALLGMHMALANAHPDLDDAALHAKLSEALTQGMSAEEADRVKNTLGQIRARSTAKVDALMATLTGSRKDWVVAGGRISAPLSRLSPLERQLWLRRMEAEAKKNLQNETSLAQGLGLSKKYGEMTAAEKKQAVDDHIRDWLESSTRGHQEDVVMAIYGDARAERDLIAEGKTGADLRKHRLERLKEAMNSDEDTQARLQSALLGMTDAQRQWALKQICIGDADGGKARLEKMASTLDSFCLADLPKDVRTLVSGAVERARTEQGDQAERVRLEEQQLKQDHDVARVLFKGGASPDWRPSLDMLRDARAEIDRVKKSTGLSDENAARTLRGEPLINEEATPGALKSPSSEAKVKERMEALEEELDSTLYVSDSTIEKALVGLSGEEMAALIDRFAAKGKDLRALLIDGADTPAVRKALHAADDFKAKQDDQRFVTALEDMKGDAVRFLGTDDGLRDELARIQSLPEDERAAQMERLSSDMAALGDDGLSRLSRAVIGDASGTGMLGGPMMERLEAIEKLPLHEQAAARARFALMTGADVQGIEARFEEAKQAKGIAEAVRQIDASSPANRMEALYELAQSRGLSFEALMDLNAKAEEAGLLPPLPVEVDPATKEVVKWELQQLRASGLAGAALQERLMAIAAAHGLDREQLLLVTKEEAEAHTREKSVEREVGQRTEDLKRALDDEDPDALQEIVDLAARNPERFRAVLEALGDGDVSKGLAKLQGGLDDAFGGLLGDDQVLLANKQVVAMAAVPPPEPPMPPALAKEDIAALRQDMLLTRQLDGGDAGDAAARRQLVALGLNPSEVEDAMRGLREMVQHDQEQFGAEVDYTLQRVQAELDDLSVDGEALKKILGDASPQVIAAVDAKLREARGQGLVEAIDEETLFLVDASVMGDLTMQLDAHAAAVNAYRSGELEIGAKPGSLSKAFDFQYRKEALAIALDPEQNGDISNKAIRTLLQTDDETLKKLIATDEEFGAKLAAAMAEDTWTTQDLWDGVAAGGLTMFVGSLLLGPAGMVVFAKGAYEAIQAAGAAKEARAAKERQLVANLVGDELPGFDSADAQDAEARQKLDEAREKAAEALIANKVEELRLDPRYRFTSDRDLAAIARAELTADPEAFEKQTKELHAKARTQAHAIFKAQEGAWGWGDDATAVHKALLAMSVHEMDLLRAEFMRQTGQSLDVFLKDELGDKDFQAAQKLMDPSQRAAGVAEMLLEGLNHWSGVEDEQFLFDTLEGMSVAERTALVKHPSFWSAKAAMMEDLGQHEIELLNALTALDPETGLAETNPAHLAAVKIKMAMDGGGSSWKLWESVGTDTDAILSELSKLDPAQVREMKRYFEQLYGPGSFETSMEEELGEGSRDTGKNVAMAVMLIPGIGTIIGGAALLYLEFNEASDRKALEIIRAELAGDKLTADAHRLQKAAEGDVLSNFGWGTDEKLLEETLLAGSKGEGGRSKKHYQALRQRFNALYGDQYDGPGDALDNMLVDECSSVELAYFQDIATTGAQDDALALLHALNGLGTKTSVVDEVLDKLADMSPDEVESFKMRFRRYAKDLLDSDETLESWIAGDLSGTAGFEATIKLRGKPQTPADHLEIARMRYEFERGGTGITRALNVAIGNPLMDFMEAAGVSSVASDFDAKTLQIESLFLPDGTLRNPDDAEFLEDLAARHTTVAKDYRELRDKAAEAIADGVKMIGSVAIGVLSGGSAAPALIAAWALATSAVKWAIKGGGVSLEEIGTDVVKAVVEGLTAKAFSHPGFEKMTKGMAAKLENVVGPMLRKGMPMKAVTDLLQDMVKNAAEGAISGFTDALITMPGDMIDGKSDGEMLSGLFRATVLGGASSVASDLLGKKLTKMVPGLDDLLKEMDTGAGLAGGPMGFMKHVAADVANGVLGGVAGKLTDVDFLQGLGDGKGLDANLVKGLVINTIVKSIVKVAMKRSDAVQDFLKVQAEAKKSAAERQRDEAMENLSPEYKALLAAREAAEGSPEHQALNAARSALEKAASEAGVVLAAGLDPDSPDFGDTDLSKHPKLRDDPEALVAMQRLVTALKTAQTEHAEAPTTQAHKAAEEKLAASRKANGPGAHAADDQHSKAVDDIAAAQRVLDTYAERREALGTDDQGARMLADELRDVDPALAEALFFDGAVALQTTEVAKLGLLLGEVLGADTSPSWDGGDRTKRLGAIVEALPPERQDRVMQALFVMSGGDADKVHAMLPAGPARDAMRRLSSQHEAVRKQLGTHDPGVKAALVHVDLPTLRAMASAENLADLAQRDDRVKGALVTMLGAQTEPSAQQHMARVVLDVSGGDFAAAQRAISSLVGTAGAAAAEALEHARHTAIAETMSELGRRLDLEEGGLRTKPLSPFEKLPPEKEAALRRLGVEVVYQPIEEIDPVIVRYMQDAATDPRGAKIRLHEAMGWDPPDLGEPSPDGAPKTATTATTAPEPPARVAAPEPEPPATVTPPEPEKPAMVTRPAPEEGVRTPDTEGAEVAAEGAEVDASTRRRRQDEQDELADALPIGVLGANGAATELAERSDEALRRAASDSADPQTAATRALEGLIADALREAGVPAPGVTAGGTQGIGLFSPDAWEITLNPELLADLTPARRARLIGTLIHEVRHAEHAFAVESLRVSRALEGRTDTDPNALARELGIPVERVQAALKQPLEPGSPEWKAAERLEASNGTGAGHAERMLREDMLLATERMVDEAEAEVRKATADLEAKEAALKGRAPSEMDEVDLEMARDEVELAKASLAGRQQAWKEDELAYRCDLPEEYDAYLVGDTARLHLLDEYKTELSAQRASAGQRHKQAHEALLALQSELAGADSVTSEQRARYLALDSELKAAKAAFIENTVDLRAVEREQERVGDMLGEMRARGPTDALPTDATPMDSSASPPPSDPAGGDAPDTEAARDGASTRAPSTSPAEAPTDAHAPAHNAEPPAEQAAPTQAPSTPTGPLVRGEPTPEVVAHLGETIATRREDFDDNASFRMGADRARYEAGIENLDVIARLSDPAVARIALDLAEKPTLEVQRRVKEAIASAGDDPVRAEANLRQLAKDMDVYEEIAASQDFRQANPDALAKAKAKGLGTEAPLNAAEEAAVLDTLIGHTRGKLVAQVSVLPVEELLTPEQLGGMCNGSQTLLKEKMEELGLVGENAPWKPVYHHTERDEQFADATSHFFTTVEARDGRVMLLDPSFAQFMNRDTDSEEKAAAGDVGRRLMKSDAGKELARRLASDGYVELTDEVARLYGQALTESEREFSRTSFARAAGIGADANGYTDFGESEEAAAYNAALPIRSADEVRISEPDPSAHTRAGTPETVSQAPTVPEATSGYMPDRAVKPMTVAGHYQQEFTAELDQIAKDYQRFNDIDSPDYNPTKAHQALRQRDLLEHITRIPDPALAEQVFRLAREGDDAQREALASAIKRIDRFPGESAEEHAERVREHIGTSSALGTAYHAMSHGTYNVEAATQAAARTLADLGEMGLIPPGMNVGMSGASREDAATDPGGIAVTVEAGTPKNGAVASYELQDDGSYKIIVSAGATHAHIQRAIAHELAEIAALDGRADNAGMYDALAPGSTVKRLSPHDKGRAAELMVLSRQLDDPSLDGDQRTRLHLELKELSLHLGLVGPGSEGRKALLFEHMAAQRELHAFSQLYHARIDETAAPARDEVFAQLQSSWTRDAKVKQGLNAMSPTDRLMIEAEWDARHAAGEAGFDAPFRVKLIEGLSGGDKYDALELLDEGRAAPRDHALPDREREAVVRAKATELQKAVNRLGDGGSPDAILAALSALRTPQEVDRFFAVAEGAHGKRYSRPFVEMVLADRLGDAEFAVASTYMRGEPVVGAALEIARALGDASVDQVGRRKRGALGQKGALDGIRRTEGWIADVVPYLVKPLPTLGGDLKSALKLDQAEKIIGILDRMDPASRKQLFGAPVFSALQASLDGALPAKGALRHKYDALRVEDDDARHAASIAADLHQALGGSGKKTDLKGRATTDREALAKTLDQLKSDPELFERTVLAYRRQQLRDAGAEVERDDLVDALLRVRSDLQQRSSWLGEENVSDVFDRGQGARHHEREALLARFDRATLDLVARDTVSALRTLRPGQPHDAGELEQMASLAEREDGAGWGMRQLLEARGVDPRKLRAYVDALHDADRKEKAHDLAAAMRNGDPDKAIRTVSDPEYKARRDKLEAMLDDPHTHQGDRVWARAELEGVQAERRKLADEVERVTDGAISAADFGFDGEPRLKGRKTRWVRLAMLQGGLSDADTAMKALTGGKGDFAALQAVFRGKSPAQARAILEEIKDQYGGDAPSAEANLTQIIASKRFDKRQRAEALLLIQGDPKALFDPGDTAMPIEARREQAKLRGQAELDAMETMHGVERKGIAARALDVNETGLDLLGWGDKTGSRLDAARQAVVDFDAKRHDALYVHLDPAAWKAREARLRDFEAARGSHLQYRDDAADSAARALGRAGGLAAGPAAHLGQAALGMSGATAKVVMGTLTKAAQLTTKGALSGKGGDVLESAARLAAETAIGVVHAPAIRVLVETTTGLPDAERDIVLSVLKEHGLHDLVKKVGSAAAGAALSSEQGPGKGIGDKVGRAIIDAAPGRLYEVGVAGVLGDADRHVKKDAPASDREDDDYAFGQFAAGVAAREAEALTDAPKALFEGAVAEATRDHASASGAARAAAERKETIRAALVEAAAHPGSGFDPSDVGALASLITAYNLSPADMAKMRVRPGAMLSACQRAWREQAEEADRQRSRAANPDPAHDARELAATQRGLDETLGEMTAAAMVSAMSAGEPIGKSTPEQWRTRLADFVGLDAHDGDPTGGLRRQKALQQMAEIAHAHTASLAAGDDASARALIAALSDYRTYERNAYAIERTTDPVYRADLERRNDRLAGRLRGRGVEVAASTPTLHNEDVGAAVTQATASQGFSQLQRIHGGFRGTVAQTGGWVEVIIDAATPEGFAVEQLPQGKRYRIAPDHVAEQMLRIVTGEAEGYARAEEEVVAEHDARSERTRHTE